MGEGLFYKLKTLIGIEEVVEDEETAQMTPVPLERKPIDTRGSYLPARNDSRDLREGKDGRVLSLQNKSRATGAGQFNLIIIETKSFDECPKLVDDLKATKPVILNLEKVESDTARKIFDFLSGATYALNGNVQKVANNIFVFAPEGVEVTVSVDSKGIDFSAAPRNVWRQP
jgi:cell division inhibitor SepF